MKIDILVTDLHIMCIVVVATLSPPILCLYNQVQEYLRVEQLDNSVSKPKCALGSHYVDSVFYGSELVASLKITETSSLDM